MFLLLISLFNLKISVYNNKVEYKNDDVTLSNKLNSIYLFWMTWRQVLFVFLEFILAF